MLQELGEKYREMLALRRLDRSGEPHDPTPRLRALARRFPGSLREIDELPLEDIERRLAALERARGGEPERWMVAMSRYHHEMRLALQVKRWLGRRRVVDAALERAFDDAHEDPARAWGRGKLALLARPPGGRLSRVVLASVAAGMGATSAQVRAWVLGEGRQARPTG